VIESLKSQCKKHKILTICNQSTNTNEMIARQWLKQHRDKFQKYLKGRGQKTEYRECVLCDKERVLRLSNENSEIEYR
jgi:hypothetical protein